MAFEAIAAYIDQIEEGFLKKESPEVVAKLLGITDKAKTMKRYKAAVWGHQKPGGRIQREAGQTPRRTAEKLPRLR